MSDCFSSWSLHTFYFDLREAQIFGFVTQLTAKALLRLGGVKCSATLLGMHPTN